MPEISEQAKRARALAKVRAAEKKANAIQEKTKKIVPQGKVKTIYFLEFLALLILLFIFDVIDILVVLGTLSIGKVITIILDIIISIFVFVWAHFRLGDESPISKKAVKRKIIRVSIKWRGKFLGTIVSEIIPFIGLIPFWTIWIWLVYSKQLREKRRIKQEQKYA